MPISAVVKCIYTSGGESGHFEGGIAYAWAGPERGRLCKGNQTGSSDGETGVGTGTLQTSGTQAPGRQTDRNTDSAERLRQTDYVSVRAIET